ncbi:MAG: FAD-binding protein [Proteobacteria bacterium]|nr:FAD-binding protein [Pseudomonadota bacterium]
MVRIDKIRESSREIDVVHETDVLVVGSGPGGLAAAIGAARAGVAAAIAVKHEQRFSELSVDLLQTELLHQGVRLS